jgi:hypothetical protein
MSSGVYNRQEGTFYPAVWTYRDLIDHLVDFSGAGVQASPLREYRTAITSAYRDVVYHRNWRYYFQNLAVVTSAPYSTGTIAYDHTGGSSERLVTLSDGTFPSWAAYGRLSIAGVFYDVAKRLGNTTLQLSATSNPGQDIAAETGYELYRSIYTLPSDYRAMHAPQRSNSGLLLQYVTPNEWQYLERRNQSSAEPTHYTIIPDNDLIGSWAIGFWPHPSSVTTQAFLMQRAARDLRISGYAAGDYVGTIAATGTAISGTNTAFTPSMIGSVLRYGTAADVPDGSNGLVPFAEQRIITAVTNATTLTIDSAFTGTVSGLKYCISDPVDAPPAMLNAILACAEYRYVIRRPSDNRPINLAEKEYQRNLVLAMESDSQVLSSGTVYVNSMSEQLTLSEQLP